MDNITLAVIGLLEEIVHIILTRGFLTNGESTKLKTKLYDLHNAIEKENNGSEIGTTSTVE